MKQKNLTEYIEGAYLKGEYLEAFLIQSAYIEGLLKLCLDFDFFTASKLQPDDFGKKDIRLTVRKRLKRYGLNEVINILADVGRLDKEQVRKLHIYRDKRNDILHELLDQMIGEKFTKDLKMGYELGREIIAQSSTLTQMQGLQSYLEDESIEQINSELAGGIVPSTKTQDGEKPPQE